MYTYLHYVYTYIINMYFPLSLSFSPPSLSLLLLLLMGKLVKREMGRGSSLWQRSKALFPSSYHQPCHRHYPKKRKLQCSRSTLSSFSLLLSPFYFSYNFKLHTWLVQMNLWCHFPVLLHINLWRYEAVVLPVLLHFSYPLIHALFLKYKRSKEVHYSNCCRNNNNLKVIYKNQVSLNRSALAWESFLVV